MTMVNEPRGSDFDRLEPPLKDLSHGADLLFGGHRPDLPRIHQTGDPL